MTSRPSRAGRRLAASRQHQQLGNFAEHVLAAAKHRAEEGARALDLLGDHLGHDIVLEEGRAKVGDLMLEGDPQVRRDRFRRRDAAPVIDHRVLHPGQIDGIVHMTHVIDVGGVDRDRVTEHGRRLSPADMIVNKRGLGSTGNLDLHSRGHRSMIASDGPFQIARQTRSCRFRQAMLRHRASAARTWRT